jgi:hypothetical protein
MSINSIKHLKEINGKEIIHMDKLREDFPQHFNSESGQMDYKWFESEIRPYYHIYVRHDVGSLTFNMLTKPASEGGDLSRCQWSDIVTLGLEMLKYLDGKFPCRENALTITKLEEALMWNEARTKNRIARGVEGKDEK